MAEELRGVILLRDEPQNDVVKKWLSWTLVMVLFMMILIYVTSYFSKSTECFGAENTGITSRDLLLNKWLYKNNRKSYV
jgi:hypothetical protein